LGLEFGKITFLEKGQKLAATIFCTYVLLEEINECNASKGQVEKTYVCLAQIQFVLFYT
jgi:hypothetical protein